MKKTLLILGAIILGFVGCKKDPVYEEGTVIDVNDGNTYIMMKPTGQSVKIN